MYVPEFIQNLGEKMGVAINGVMTSQDILALKTAVCLIPISLLISSLALLILVVSQFKLKVSVNKLNSRQITAPK